VAFKCVDRNDRRKHPNPTWCSAKLEVDHLAGQTAKPASEFAATLTGGDLEPADGVPEPTSDLIDAAHHKCFAADRTAQFAVAQFERDRKAFAAANLPMNAGLGDLEVQILAKNTANTSFKGVLVEFCTNVKAVGLATDAANDVKGGIDLTHG
jgi:hypothetical protein